MSSLWVVFLIGITIDLVPCGHDRIDDTKSICCEGVSHPLSWGPKTECCGMFAFSRQVETCCEGQINPGYGVNNRNSKCCGQFSYDSRCFECLGDGETIKPKFDYRSELCCDGSVRRLLDNKTCCCGSEAFNPTNKVCCDERIIDRPKDMPGDCCSCGLTKVDIVIILDASESITLPNWPKMLKFATEILADAEIDDDNVRVGLLTYRHNATVEFHLDDYHNKKQMFNAITSIPYIRGSTNTGMAIEMARTEMFNPARGDRPNVDNVAIVVTDGDSDDYQHSIEQAQMAKDSKIHVFAIGIALKNLTELKNIASPPAEKNVLSIDDFDHLETLKGQIFASICTEECGQKEFFHPDHEVCCDGQPQPLKGGKENTRCCGQTSYSKSEEVCCDGAVSPSKGKNTQCCGQVGYDPSSEVCCRGNAVPKLGPQYTECCGIYSYDPNTEVCCEETVNKAFGNPSKDTGCCADFSYDKRCWECTKGELTPLFDPECQICCDGVIHPMEPGLSCCCGQDIFQPRNQICCDGKLRKRQGSETGSTCCECGSALVDLAIVVDSSESVGYDNWNTLKDFVEGLIKNSEVDEGRTRIAFETYRHNVTLEFKFNDYLRKANMLAHLRYVDYVRGSSNAGDALKMLTNEVFTSEAGDRHNVPNIAIVVLDGTSDDPDHTRAEAEKLKETGCHVYAIAVGFKINDELKAIASEPWKDNVFTAANFEDLFKIEASLSNVISDVCPQPCGKTLYDPKTEVCCNGQPQPAVGDLKLTRCCDIRSYNVKKQMCCNKKVNVLPPGKPECCDTEAYDPRDAMCCYGNTVLPRTSESASECCGNSTYDTIDELCCEDVLYQNYGDEGESGACCVLSSGRTVSYDRRCYNCVKGELVARYDCARERCCDGRIQPIYWPESCCCGKVAFNPVDQICCDKKLKKRKPEDDRTCCECASNIMDIVVILDSSESVGLDNWRQMELFVEDLINDSNIPDARFGLLTYKHNVSLEFHLNTYFDKKALMEAVDNLPYVRGSTNTGMAIEVVRKQMFTPRTGDRDRAPNFVVLITDGQSDDPKYTVDQAEFAKAQGIHIIALGVGLKDVKELRAVASPPADDNAISLKNFEELEAVKQRIFNDLAKSVCPLPCGNSSIDERMEICCNGVPQKLVAGSRTVCCGYVAYDPDCFMCCEDNTLVSKYAGEFTECCCKWAYDSRSHLCCGNQILPKVAGKFSECCHNETYDTRTQVCCDLTTVQPSYGKDNTECCNGVSYDTRCDECTRKGVSPLYDVEEELCCDGEISKKEFGEKSCCCGKKQFNSDIGICCEDNYYDRPKGDEVTCCGKNIHNAKKEICCDDNVQPRLNGFDTGCCNELSFDPRKQHCCEGKINKKKNDKETCCCANTVFDFEKSICCDGKVNKLTKAGNRSSSVCCGNKAFDPLKKICCGGKVNKLKKKGASTACCGKKAYDPQQQLCDDGKVKKINGECANIKYNPKTQTCCNGWINNATFKEPWARCCFGEAYDAREKVCCCNGNLEDAFAGIFTQCCYSYAYDSRTHTCCDGQVVRKPYPSAECCCERQAYDSNREICCGGKVRACGGDKRKCCGTEAYDPMLEICCDGKLHDRRFGDETYCCGSESYTPMLAVCCGERIAYRKKISMEW
ncbi:hypothetical protein ACF0H5_014351 [Mactra antiquata]